LIAAKSKPLNPGPGSGDFRPACRNIVALNIAPDTRGPKRPAKAAAEMVPRLVPTRKTGNVAKRFLRSPHRGKIRGMLLAEAKFVAHAPAALLVRRRIDNRGDNAAIDELAAAAHEKVAGTKSNLLLFLAQSQQAARSEKQDRHSLGTLRHPGEKKRLCHAVPGRQGYDLLGPGARRQHSGAKMHRAPDK
jgi:hypothetical protein